MPEVVPTRKRLRLALTKLKRDAGLDGKTGPSISAVAREAGVSHALIHTKYPDIAEEIRSASGRGPKQQLQNQTKLVKHAKKRSAELRKELVETKNQNRGLASENARLLLRVGNLEREVTSLESGVTLLRHERATGQKS